MSRARALAQANRVLAGRRAPPSYPTLALWAAALGAAAAIFMELFR